MKSKDRKLKVFYKSVELKENDCQDRLNEVFNFLFDEVLRAMSLGRRTTKAVSIMGRGREIVYQPADKLLSGVSGERKSQTLP